jgi:hypothetical protein
MAEGLFHLNKSGLVGVIGMRGNANNTHTAHF